MTSSASRVHTGGRNGRHRKRAIGDCGVDLNLDGVVDNLVEASVGSVPARAVHHAHRHRPNPDDYKRIVTLVRWNKGSGNRYALQSTTVSNPGLSAGPRSLTPTSALVTTSPDHQRHTAITSPSWRCRRRPPSNWMLDGTPQGTASGSRLGPWTFTLGPRHRRRGQPSGRCWTATTSSGAKALRPVRRLRQHEGADLHPEPARALRADRLRGRPQQRRRCEFEWSPNKERDVVGYRVYRTTNGVGGGLQPHDGDSCQDTNPPGGLFVNYYVVAVDRDPTTGALREGDASSAITRHQPQQRAQRAQQASRHLRRGRPRSPGRLPARGPRPRGLRRLLPHLPRRRGVRDRYDRTASGTQPTLHRRPDRRQTHTYRVTAVDTQLAESTLVGPVTR